MPSRNAGGKDASVSGSSPSCWKPAKLKDRLIAAAGCRSQVSAVETSGSERRSRAVAWATSLMRSIR